MSFSNLRKWIFDIKERVQKSLNHFILENLFDFSLYMNGLKCGVTQFILDA